MELKLIDAGKLLAHRDDKRLEQRRIHVHNDLRREFHKQLKRLWNEHPILVDLKGKPAAWHTRPGAPKVYQIFDREGFKWLPIVTEDNGLICKLDILLLRHGPTRSRSLGHRQSAKDNFRRATNGSWSCRTEWACARPR
jgi:hypothetical protein